MFIKCPKCNFTQELPEDKIPSKRVWATCPVCKEKFVFDPFLYEEDTILVPESSKVIEESGTTTSSPEPPPVIVESKYEEIEENPWEEQKGGFWHGLIWAIKTVLFNPTKFFQSISIDNSVKYSIGFAILVSSWGSYIQFIWQFVTGMGRFPFVHLSSIVLFFILLFIPVFVVIMIYISSFFTHLFLRIVGSGEKGFGATLRVIAYSQAGMLWNILPIVGNFVGTIWVFVIEVIGLKTIHDTTTGRVLLAMFLPILIIIGLVIGIMVVLGLHM